jgi:4-hydroxy-tetrahydrodipicolinate reductase
MSLRVILFGLGPIGAAIGRLTQEKPNMKIVGAIDVDPAKVGQDVGQVIGLGRDLGVAVSADMAAVLATPADVVLHCTGSYLENVKDQLEACLKAGKNVVSTCEELAYSRRKHPALTANLDQVARDNGVTLHGTGVNPGFVMDKLPLTLTSVCQQVHRVDVTRIVDAGKRRLPLQKKVGAGMTEQEFRQEVDAGRIKHHGLPESAAMIADYLGLPVTKIEEAIEPVMATAPVTTEFLTVQAGQVAGVKQICEATGDGKLLVRLELQMYVGAPDAADTVHVHGTPDLTLTIPGGTHGDLATAAAAVNAVPLVAEAREGLRTAADLPVRFAPGKQVGVLA